MIKTPLPGNNPHGSEMPDPSGSSEAVMGGAAVAGVLPSGSLLESEIKSTVRPTDREARLRWMVDEYIDFVARVLRNAGTPAAEVDDDVQRTFIAAARRLDDVRPGAERSRIWEQQKIDQPQFAEYEKKTTREIPVIVLERAV